MSDCHAEANQNPHHARVQAVFQGRWPDRIPICEQAFASSVASAILGRQVYTGSTDVMYAEACAWLDGDKAHNEFVSRVLDDVIELHRYFDFDILFMPWRISERPSKRIDEHRILYGDPDGTEWAVYKFDPHSRTYGIERAAQSGQIFESVVEQMRRTIKAGSHTPPAVEELLQQGIDRYGREFVIAGGAGMAIPMSSGWLEAVAREPKLIADYLDVVLEEKLENLRLQHEAGITLINGGGDFAFNAGPAYSPVFFKGVMLPRWRKVFDYCRDLGIYYIMRSDGNLWPVAEDLFGLARPDAYYEVDYDAGMRFDNLRSRFPELVLIGNVSCKLLHSGSADEVRRVVRECIDSAGPRVIASSSNAILHGTPVENVFALYETAKTYLQNAGTL